MYKSTITINDEQRLCLLQEEHVVSHRALEETLLFSQFSVVSVTSNIPQRQTSICIVELLRITFTFESIGSLNSGTHNK